MFYPVKVDYEKGFRAECIVSMSKREAHNVPTLTPLRGTRTFKASLHFILILQTSPLIYFAHYY